MNRSILRNRCTNQFFKYKDTKSFDVPSYIKKRLGNFHIPGHSEILVYAFHNSKIVDKKILRDIFDTDTQKSTINGIFAKLKLNLENFVPVKLGPQQ